MKRLKMGVLVLISCLFLTACGCSKDEFIVSFDSNGGTNVSSQTVEKGGKVTKPVDPIKEGYTFDGWYIDLGEDDSYDFNSDVTKDFTLEAKWVKKTDGDEDKKVCNLTCDEGYELINGDKENCECIKKEETTTIKLSKTNLSLVVGNSTTVTVTLSPSSLNEKDVAWKSNNTKVATVKDGKITAVNVGTATITATIDGKSATVKVTVTTQETASLNAALSKIQAKTISKGNTGINYTYSGCTIINTTNTVSNSNIVVENGVVTKLYRGTSAGSISSTYKVTCGSKTQTKTVKHTVPASTYKYTYSQEVTYRILVSGAKNYTLSTPDGKISNLGYNEKIDGVQTGPDFKVGTVFNMVFDNDPYTIYSVKQK